MPEDSAIRTVAVCGAGMAGLALAIALTDCGWRVTVIEARDEEAIREEGAFLTLAPNGVNALRAVGCFNAVMAAGVVTRGIEIRNAKGRRLGLIDQTSEAADLGAPSLTISRGALAGLLLDAARTAGADLLLGRPVEGVETSDASAQVRLADGLARRFDLVIGADGLRSAVRRSVFPEAPQARFTGLMGEGGVVETSAPSTGGVMRMTFGEQAFFGYLKAETGPAYWFSAYEYPAGQAEREEPAAHADRVRRMHAHDPAPNAQVLQSVDRIGRSYPIYELPPLPKWSRGRVLVIGDAAHAVGPHAGQGASMAIEDAVVLTACLRAQPTVRRALERFEALRRPRVEEVARLTARNGAQKRTHGAFSLWLRDLLMPLFIPLGAKTSRRLCVFRADTDPLAAET